MSILNRYKQENVIEHLASHYVLGGLTALVRSRVEVLAKQSPELQQQINMWQLRFEGMNHAKAISPPEFVWKKIKNNVLTNQYKSKGSLSTIINSFWRTAAVTFSLVLTLIILIPNQDVTTPVLGYTAAMHGVNDQEIQFIVNVYKDNDADNTFIKLLMNQRKTNIEISGVLWSKSFGSEELVQLGAVKTLIEQNILTKEQWTLIKQSESLIITRDDSILSERIYEGVCVQLGDWG
ncbi:hypothetical protein [Marinicellulosiphila megalodicopiae]|uniref:hypothetical protein n=1 Tax=Marinicellulosiphila megalodicopiae TaxID=2724896 RepID=UPI003BB08678